ncbi:hypothetical protein VNI00_007760 [Paramarasmius palmivorus]|uniref:Uncharacterized protein n=1 Tax=Paramarasmius palmivorus TaxID=297713 RepID=A0AAW0CZY3_9AGAR
MRRVSSSVRQQVTEYDAVAFCLNNLYGPFFHADKITEFRRVQAKTRALVSGSALVSFLSRGAFEPSDLDVFVPCPGLLLIGEFLLDEGFTFEPIGARSEDEQSLSRRELFTKMVSAPRSSWLEDVKTILDESYDELTLGGVFNFVSEGGKTVQLIGTKCEPIEFILQFYSSKFFSAFQLQRLLLTSEALVMNIATPTRVISMYPFTSFVLKDALYLKYPSDRVVDARFKYEKRGWTSSSMISADTALDPDHELSTKTRWVGDRNCWIVQFPPVPGFPDAEESYRSLGITSWHLYCPTHNGVRVQTNKMEADYLPYPLVITWEAERAVWRRECLLAASPGSTFSRGVQTSPVSDTSGDSGDDMSDAEVSEALGDAIIDHDMEAGIVEFLGRLYPRIDKEFRCNGTMDQLRRDFLEARDFYGKVVSEAGLPTGHVVFTILQCIKDVQNMGVSDRVEFNLRFWLDWEELVVWTTCTILVPPEHEIKVKRCVPPWQIGSVDFASLLVEISSPGTERFR